MRPRTGHYNLPLDTAADLSVSLQKLPVYTFPISHYRRHLRRLALPVIQVESLPALQRFTPFTSRSPKRSSCMWIITMDLSDASERECLTDVGPSDPVAPFARAANFSS